MVELNLCHITHVSGLQNKGFTELLLVVVVFTFNVSFKDQILLDRTSSFMLMQDPDNNRKVKIGNGEEMARSK